MRNLLALLLLVGLAALLLQGRTRVTVLEAPLPSPRMPSEGEMAAHPRPEGASLQLRQGEEALLEYLDTGSAQARERAVARLTPLLARPESQPFAFLPRLYLTFLGTLPREELNPGRQVLYGFVFEHPDRPAADWIRARLRYPTDYALPQIYAQVGGANFDSERTAENEAFMELLGPLEGKRVAEVGGGLGYLAWGLAERVGDAGRVTLVDLDAGLGEFAEYTANQDGYRELAPRLRFRPSVSPTDPGIRDQDVVTMQDVHILCDPEYQAFGREQLPRLHEGLKPGGLLAVMETFRKDVDPERARARVEEAGFRVQAIHPLRKGAGFVLLARRG